MSRTILITGANRGIGLALARIAAQRGDQVIALVRRPGEALALVEAARATGRIDVLGADVTEPGQLAAIAEDIQPTIDLAVCNAGQFRARGGIDDPEYTPDAWHEMFMTNVAGVFFTVRAVLPKLEAASGKVAVISSLMGSTERAPGGSYIYRASKAAASNLARNLAAELAPRGVAVGAYHPGWVRTDMGGEAADLAVEESADGLLARFDALTLETTGALEDFRGDAVPY